MRIIEVHSCRDCPHTRHICLDNKDGDFFYCWYSMMRIKGSCEKTFAIPEDVFYDEKVWDKCPLKEFKRVKYSIEVMI